MGSEESGAFLETVVRKSSFFKVAPNDIVRRLRSICQFDEALRSKDVFISPLSERLGASGLCRLCKAAACALSVRGQELNTEACVTVCEAFAALVPPRNDVWLKE